MLKVNAGGMNLKAGVSKMVEEAQRPDAVLPGTRPRQTKWRLAKPLFVAPIGTVLRPALQEKIAEKSKSNEKERQK